MKSILYILIFSITATAAVAEKPSCGVLDFKYGKGFTQREARELSNRTSIRLAGMQKYKVAPRHKISVILRNTPTQDSSDTTPYYLWQGRRLGLDYIIFGSVYKKDGKTYFITALCNVKTAEIEKSIKTYFSGKHNRFLAIAPTANLQKLFREEQKTATAASSKPAPAPVKTQKPEAKKVQAEEKQKKQWALPAIPALPTMPTLPSIPTLEETTEAATEIYDKYAKRWVEGNLVIGLRSTYFKLRDTQNEDFLGSINELKSDQDLIPDLVVDARVWKDFWVSISSSHMRAVTWTKEEPEYGEPGYTDGTFDVKGASLAGRYKRTFGDWAAFVELGMIMYDASFDHNPEWRDAGGRINSHIIEASGNTSFFFALGGEYMFTERFGAHLYFRNAAAEVDYKYVLNGVERATGRFPLDNYSTSLGIIYAF